jgi:hypothetical protein
MVLHGVYTQLVSLSQRETKHKPNHDELLKLLTFLLDFAVRAVELNKEVLISLHFILHILQLLIHSYAIANILKRLEQSHCDSLLQGLEKRDENSLSKSSRGATSHSQYYELTLSKFYSHLLKLIEAHQSGNSIASPSEKFQNQILQNPIARKVSEVFLLIHSLPIDFVPGAHIV